MRIDARRIGVARGLGRKLRDDLPRTWIDKGHRQLHRIRHPQLRRYEQIGAACRILSLDDIHVLKVSAKRALQRLCEPGVEHLDERLKISGVVEPERGIADHCSIQRQLLSSKGGGPRNTLRSQISMD